MATRLAIALVATLLVLTACASSATAVLLDAREFVAVGVTDGGIDRPLAPGTQIRLSFENGNVSLNAGCNHIGGAYRVDGGRLIVGDLASTAIGCDPARHAQDEWLSRFLGSGPLVSIDGANLVLESGTVRLALVDSDVAQPGAGSGLVGDVAES